MNGMIESISTYLEGATILKIVISDMDASELRLGEVTITQKKHEQQTLTEY